MHHNQLFLEQKYYVHKTFVSKNDHCTHSSSKVKLCSHLRCKIAGDECNNVLDEDSMSNMLLLAVVTDSHRVNMDTCIDDAFQSHASKRIAHYGCTKDRMHLVNGHSRNRFVRSECRSMFEWEGTKGKKICLTNLEVENFLTFLPASVKGLK